MPFFKRQARKTRTVFVIKHPSEIYLIRSGFFKSWRGRKDIDLPRSKESREAAAIVSAFVRDGSRPVLIGYPGFVFDDVQIGVRERVDVRLVILHAESDHEIHTNEVCTPLSDHIQLDKLLRQRVVGTKLVPTEKIAV